METVKPGSILDVTMAAAVKDRATVTTEGTPLGRLIDGVTIRRIATQIDDRGTVTELFDARWATHPDPLVFSYAFSIRPGYAKGWSLHEKHEDRYVLLYGRLELVLFDARHDSPTYQDVCRIVLSESDRCIVNVPAKVWHADHNIGSTDAIVVNFPTIPYDHADPDKWRLPLDTPLIPYRFPADIRGG